MTILTVFVAAGAGERAGGGLPKQYRVVAGEALIARALRPFLGHAAIDAVVCAINPEHRALYDAAVAPLEEPLRRKLLPPVAGGATRQASVHAALEALAADDGGAASLCLVHDAARPFASSALINRAIAAGMRHGAAIPAVAITDTVKRVGADDAVLETVPRDSLRGVQTPQVFALAPLLDAHRRAAAERREGFTDDAQIVEWAGLQVIAFEGDPMNVKITRPEDFAAAERRLRDAAPALVSRTGTGFDVHAFGPGHHVWLGGVRIDHEVGVLAHSDGDVVLHALTDAVLGALCDGDIGTHFPPSDPQWRGASSDRFLAYAADLVRARGGRIDHLDSTVLCERPRIGVHREAIRQRIAEIAGIPVSRVSVKATTTEQLGFTGRREGLAAQASATIRLPESEA